MKFVTCQICGAKFSATKENESCPVCMLRQALAGGGESSATLLCGHCEPFSRPRDSSASSTTN